MLTHHHSPARTPTRVVVVGAAGFVGRAAMERLASAGAPALGVTRRDVDLLGGPDSAKKLASFLRPDDAVVMIAAKAPAKNSEMVVDNVRMMDAVCVALTESPVAHLVYVSSDAVYADSKSPLSESSCAEPASFHGAMHLVREVMLANTFPGPLCILRPTLIYGPADPHNGYGPNSFRRLAAAGNDIVLYGEGEERRDHVFVDDVAEIVLRVLLHRSSGKLNVATGRVTSFRKIAEKVVKLAGGSGKISRSPRKGAMPHDGYRAFDVAATAKAFPDFRYTPLDDGLARTRDAEQGRHTAFAGR